MGKLLSGRYGNEPEAESIELPLRDCHMKLGLKPSDFISVGEPDFFNKAYGASGHYLVYRLHAKEVEGSPLWKAGYYLLPIQAADVLKAFEKSKLRISGPREYLPVEHEDPETVIPPEVLKRAHHWTQESQPLFFRCGCDKLQLKIFVPWGLRRRWKARLRCPGRCQPALSTLL